MRVYALSSIGFLALGACVPAYSQQFSKDNLAPYVPSPQVVVDRMLQAARVKPGEVVYDLGSGDGRIIITAAQQYHARAVGVEWNRDLCKSTQARIRSLGLEDRVKLIQANMLKVDLSPADVVTLYLLTSSNERLRPNLEKYLKRGARVVSNDYEITGWTPSGIVPVTAGGVLHYIYVYEVGAR
jgi:16S rRNA A1518/A1519 N6-dimethyltransferase RsmA/KsgA/DIM1 with predicted DNA glycosylase/AP lyase activity